MEPRQWPKISLSGNLGKRIIAGAILAPIVLAIIFKGGILYQLLIAAAALIILSEWYGMVATRHAEWSEQKIRQWNHLGLLYSFAFAASLLYLRNLPEGTMNVLWVVMVVWATDIAAYAAGRMIGGAKLAPTISPNKTWAGLGGGMIAAAMIGGITAMLMPSDHHFLSAFYGAALGAVLAVVAQGGDLLESWIKRQCNVKDSGTIIPGHGGIMDRVDGLVAVSTIVALITLVNNGKVLG